VQPDGFVERTGSLLYVFFKPDDAYLIGIFPHRAWVREEVIRIMVREWPTANLAPELNGAVGMAPPSLRRPYHAFAQRFSRARGEHGLKMVGTLQALGLGGMYQRPKMGVYVDNNGRQWQNQRSRDGGQTGEGTPSTSSSSALSARGPTPAGLGKVKTAPGVGSSETSSVVPRRDRSMRRLEAIWRVDPAGVSGSGSKAKTA
jgi:hypothetical protein